MPRRLCKWPIKCYLFNWPTSLVEIEQLYDGDSLLPLLSSWEDVKLRPFIITGIVCAFRGFKFEFLYIFFLIFFTSTS